MFDMSPRVVRWFAELRRRKVVRVAVVYILIAWVLIQIADATFDPIGLPPWAHKLVIVLAALGFPLACGLAWAFDVTPRGIERAQPEPAGNREPSSAPVARTAAGPGAAAGLAPQPAHVAALAAGASPSVAILPFADMSPARDQGYFCDGITEEIINALSGVRGLQVASRTSSFQFKDRAADVREIGRSLGVTAVLEGSVRRSEERARITAQLVSTNDGFHLWSESFDRGLEDIFATQSEIAQNVVRALRSSLTKEEAAIIERGGTRNPQAYEYYLRARQLHNEQSDTTIKQSIELYRRAAQADPDFAKAHAGLAMALASATFWRMVEPGAMEEAMRAARRARELAPDLPEAWLAQGNLYSASLQYDLADRAFEKALAGNPDSFEVLLLYGRHAFSAGQTAKSVELFERAQRVEPQDYQVAALLAGSVRKLGNLEAALEADRAAIKLLERRIELYPDDTRALHLAAGVYAKLGQRERAIAVAERALALRPREFATLYNVACAYAQLGEKDRALAILEGFSKVGQGSFDWIRQDPDFQSLHGDPRFERVVEHLSDLSRAPGTG
jgi:adenylate cyclase